ncbi:hypothetical protein D0817_23315 [Flavobacterium cupreum]|uniref:Uncharacterized protein n=1 Tax=Flavobacterium cupreum TaxID=2133766 RepID=A0A434A133_9FLAO|nr:hypothetical protein D0817_23315 [Flavobacterium cupreum]
MPRICTNYFHADLSRTTQLSFYRKARKVFASAWFGKTQVRKAGSIQSFANFAFSEDTFVGKTLRALR